MRYGANFRRNLLTIKLALFVFTGLAQENWAIWHYGPNTNGVPTNFPVQIEYIGTETNWPGAHEVCGYETWRTRATAITAGLVAPSRLGSGTANATTFLRGDGTWNTPPGGGGSVVGTSLVARVTLDRTTTSLTAVAVTDAAFSVGANERYVFTFSLRLGSSSTAGLKLALAFPAGATLMATAQGNTTASGIATDVFTASGTLGATRHTLATQTGVCAVSGTILNGANAGTVQLQFAKVTSGTATVCSNSFLTAIKF